MPQIQVQDRTLSCAEGANLRQVLLQEGVQLYNPPAHIVNCHGLGTCGTCAVQIEGEVSPMGWRERTRLSLPPHQLSKGLRLACQVQVFGDLKVTKWLGMWGEKLPAAPPA
ncbi:2Fe-2S iron-sulfur cluster-binding protein [uncultured Thermosynechococcus sp.]|uniref:2Fe-2S iron-sulfur cluster-binding protein n=1 Tax=uncultured Thermosynechococcus sp. TaxID=436945 RepID=UPI002637DAAA|nr:2Fe-2S iron-sulfur cluster-binding protein [uncultured Thermosynechococcus sp.]